MTSSDKYEELELWVLLNRTRDAMYRVRQKELSQYGVTPMQAVALEIARALGDKARPVRGTISGVCKRHQKKI